MLHTISYISYKWPVFKQYIKNLFSAHQFSYYFDSFSYSRRQTSIRVYIFSDCSCWYWYWYWKKYAGKHVVNNQGIQTAAATTTTSAHFLIISEGGDRRHSGNMWDNKQVKLFSIIWVRISHYQIRVLALVSACLVDFPSDVSFENICSTWQLAEVAV